MTTMNETSIQGEIRRLEASRCLALVEVNLDTLDDLVADDVVHVHANGKTDDKAAYLAMVRGQIRFLTAVRERLDVQVYGDMAVATGTLRQSIEMAATGERVDMHIVTTQVWRRHAGTWKQVSFHATNL
jgi:ketosteroid isomerase-like protein